mmetsp:Transcript_10716/g.25533  ORF Transcript_10716/g.25533 Transcript_10716/m.25533 type:complete len:513 (-) Transcript_10716:195-1733(-)
MGDGSYGYNWGDPQFLPPTAFDPMMGGGMDRGGGRSNRVGRKGGGNTGRRGGKTPSAGLQLGTELISGAGGDSPTANAGWSTPSPMYGAYGAGQFPPPTMWPPFMPMNPNAMAALAQQMMHMQSFTQDMEDPVRKQRTARKNKKGKDAAGRPGTAPVPTPPPVPQLSPAACPGLQTLCRSAGKSPPDDHELVEHADQFVVHPQGVEYLITTRPDMLPQVCGRLRGSIPDLCRNEEGKKVIIKFIESKGKHASEVIKEIAADALALSQDGNGCRVVQKAITVADVQQQMALTKPLEGHVVTLVRDMHGNHVIQRCVEEMPSGQTAFIVRELMDGAAEHAKHAYGCRILQRLFEHSDKEQLEGILKDVLDHNYDLITDKYANYVIQHVLEHGAEKPKRTILATIEKNIVEFAKNKFASNVVERAFANAGEEAKSTIIRALVNAGDEDHGNGLLELVNHKFGNYVVQGALSSARAEQKVQLENRLRSLDMAAMRANRYGKHIAQRLEGDNVAVDG